MIICEFCKKTLSDERKLELHHKSKNCLKARNNIEPSLIEDRFHCEYCDKYLSSKQRVDQHKKTCVFKFNKLLEEKDKLLEEKDKLLEEKDNEITDLKQLVKNIKYETEIDLLRNDCKHSKEVIERIAEQPKTTTNTTNTTNNTNLILPMIDTSHEHIELMVQENYTENHLLGGQAGVAQFTKDNLLLDSEHNLGFVCTDAARKTFKRKGEDGKIVKDIRAINLTKDIAKPIKKKAGEHTTNIISRYGFESDTSAKAIEKYDDVNKIEDNNSGFTSRLASLTSI